MYKMSLIPDSISKHKQIYVGTIKIIITQPLIKYLMLENCHFGPKSSCLSFPMYADWGQQICMPFDADSMLIGQLAAAAIWLLQSKLKIDSVTFDLFSSKAHWWQRQERSKQINDDDEQSLTLVSDRHDHFNFNFSATR